MVVQQVEHGRKRTARAREQRNQHPDAHAVVVASSIRVEAGGIGAAAAVLDACRTPPAVAPGLAHPGAVVCACRAHTGELECMQTGRESKVSNGRRRGGGITIRAAQPGG